MIEYGLFLAAAYLSAMFATVAGFGSSTLLVPIAIFFVDFQSAIFWVACFHLLNNIFKVKLFLPHIDYKVFAIFGVPSILFAFIGARFISIWPVEILTKVLAVFLIVFSAFSFVRPDFRVPANPANAVLGGSISGFFAGLIGLGGALRSMFLLSFGLPKENYVATAALIAFVVDLTRIPTYLTGRVGAERNIPYLFLIFLTIIAYAGVRTGKLLLTRIKQEVFHKVVLAALFAIGLKLLF